MAIPTLPDVNLSVDLSGAACCSNNKKVVHDQTSGSFVVKERSCLSRFFCCAGDSEKDENRRALRAFKRAVEDHCNMPFEDVAYDAAGIDSKKMTESGENLKPQHFDQIANHARPNGRKSS